MSVPTTALPADLLPVAHLYGVVAKFFRGDPGSGTVTFKTTGAVIAGDPPILIYGYEQTVTLDPATGRFQIDWVPGDDPDGAPSTVTMTFDLDNDIVIPPLTIIVPTPHPIYPQLVTNGVPQVDAGGQPVPDTTKTPTFANINVFAQPTVPVLSPELDTTSFVDSDTNLFLRSAQFGAPNGVATLEFDGTIPVQQLFDPVTFPAGSALTYDPAHGGIAPVAVDARWRGAVASIPTDAGTQGDYFTNTTLTDGGAFMWGCVRDGGPVQDGSPDEALWVPFGGGGGSGGDGSGGVIAVQGTSPIQSTGGFQPSISILAATAVQAGSMSAAHFAKLNGIAANATAYNDELAQDAAARMILGGSHVGITFTYDDNGNTLTGTVVQGSGAVAVVGANQPLIVGGTTSNPVLSINPATSGQDGFMTALQASRLQGMSDGATKNQTDSYLLNRANQQGTLQSSVISDLEAVVRGYAAIVRTVTSSPTLALSDEVLRVNSSSALTVTVPTNAVVAIPIGAFVTVSQVGSGVVTIAGSAVTLNGYVKTGGQNTDVSLLKVGTNEWDVRGGVA